MHFYEFNIGDYAKKTQHLTNEEDLAYRRLLDMYYDTENPLVSTGIATLSRRLRVSESAIKNVLDEFFPNGKNKHADEKIAAYHEYLIKQKLNGSKGGRPKHKPTANPPLTQNNPVPSQPLTTNHYPLTTNQEGQKHTHPSDAMSPSTKKTPKADSIPYQKIVDLYHETLPALPKVALLTAKRKGQIAARWTSGYLPDLESWGEFFHDVGKSKFLTGQCDPVNGHKRFVANLEWITSESNFTKIMEGKYHGN